MKNYIAKRLLQLLPILLGITLLSFLLMNTGAADAVDVMESNTGSAMTEDEKIYFVKNWGFTGRFISNI